MRVYAVATLLLEPKITMVPARIRKRLSNYGGASLGCEMTCLQLLREAVVMGDEPEDTTDSAHCTMLRRLRI